MRSRSKTAMVVFAGVVFGGAVVEMLHAQAAPPVYLVTEVTVSDPAVYRKEYVPKAQAVIKAAGIRELALGGLGESGPQITAIEGEAPKRVVIQIFDSLESLKAFRASADYKAAKAIGDKYATFRSYAVDGASH
jgi:uncharacterized protein (DUF1330 family)